MIRIGHSSLQTLQHNGRLSSEHAAERDAVLMPGFGSMQARMACVFVSASTEVSVDTHEPLEPRLPAALALMSRVHASLLAELHKSSESKQPTAALRERSSQIKIGI